MQLNEDFFERMLSRCAEEKKKASDAGDYAAWEHWDEEERNYIAYRAQHARLTAA